MVAAAAKVAERGGGGKGGGEGGGGEGGGERPAVVRVVGVMDLVGVEDWKEVVREVVRAVVARAAALAAAQAAAARVAAARVAALAAVPRRASSRLRRGDHARRLVACPCTQS